MNLQLDTIVYIVLWHMSCKPNVLHAMINTGYLFVGLIVVYASHINLCNCPMTRAELSSS